MILICNDMTALIIIIITLALVVFICIERNLDAKANEISNKAISISSFVIIELFLKKTELIMTMRSCIMNWIILIIIIKLSLF